MKRKIVTGMIIMATMFVLTACGKQSEVVNENTTETDAQITTDVQNEPDGSDTGNIDEQEKLNDVPEQVVITGKTYSTDITELTIHHVDRYNTEMVFTEEDFENLFYLVNLENLFLSECELTDISFVENMPNLKELSLPNNQISDLSPLASLTKLESLTLNTNQITDLSPLANLTTLTRLSVNGNQISDITPLTNLTQVYSLDIANNNITDLTPLRNMTELKYLYMVSNDTLKDISPLSGLSNLETLDIDRTEVTDLSCLYGLTNLQTIELNSLYITMEEAEAFRTALPDCEIEW